MNFYDGVKLPEYLEIKCTSSSNYLIKNYKFYVYGNEYCIIKFHEEYDGMYELLIDDDDYPRSHNPWELIEIALNMYNETLRLTNPELFI